MKALIKEIPATAFKDYIVKMKSCKPGPSYQIESKFGTLSFQFKDEEPDYISFNIKRTSGNGIGLVTSGSKSIDFKVNSQRYEVITFPIQDKKITLKRSQRSTGIIEISGISLYSNSDAPKVDWHSVLKNCEIESINIVGEKLLAAEGSVLKAAKIEEIVTSPPGLVTNLGNEAYFLGSCEITKLIVHNKPKDELYKHLPEEPTVLRPEPKQDKTTVTYSKIEIKPRKPQIEDPGINRLVYDSSVHGFSKYTSINNVEINKDYVILDFNAEYRIPLKFIYPNSDYIVIVEAHILSGNGKITITMDTAINDSNAAMILGQRKKSINKKIRTSGNLDGANLIIGRSSSGKGKILISKILLILDIDKTVKYPVARFFSNENKGSLGYSDTNDKVLQTSLAFARHVSNHNFSQTYSLIGSLSADTFSGMLWFSKMQPLVPKVNINDPINKFLITSSKRINKPYEKIFIEEFDEDKINEGMVKILEKSGVIFTSSDRNAEYLSSVLNNVSVQKTIKYWPFAIPDPISFIKDKFVLIFNRKPEITNKVLPALRGICPKVVVVGARGRYPEDVIPVNEYLNYNNLCWLLYNAECVVDIPPVSDYFSGALELLNHMNVPIATSNWCYQDRNNVKFLVSTEKLDEHKIPEEKIIVEGVREMIASNIQKIKPTEDYNKKVVDEFSKYF